MIGAILAAAVAAGPPPDPVSSALRAARSYDLAHTNDRFADPPSPIPAGQRFNVSVGVIDGTHLGMAKSSAYWTYEKGVLRILMTFEEVPGVRGDDAPKVIFINATSSPGPSYVGENGFGAKRQVSVTNWRRDALAIQAAPKGEIFPTGMSDAAIADIRDRLPHNTYYVDLQVPPAEGRRLSTAVRFELAGEVATLPTGKTAACAAWVNGPTIDYPTDVREHDCWLGAKLTSIILRDTGTGQVLKSW